MNYARNQYVVCHFDDRVQIRCNDLIFLIFKNLASSMAAGLADFVQILER